ncbi:hypothetical protein EMIT0158MI4_10003 [Burkholderia ambifaria]
MPGFFVCDAGIGAAGTDAGNRRNGARVRPGAPQPMECLNRVDWRPVYSASNRPRRARR